MEFPLRVSFPVLLLMLVLLAGACRTVPEPVVDEFTAGMEVQFLASGQLYGLIDRIAAYAEHHRGWPVQAGGLSRIEIGEDAEPLDLGIYESVEFLPQPNGGLLVTFTLKPFEVTSEAYQRLVYHVSKAEGTVEIPPIGDESGALVGWSRLTVSDGRGNLIFDLPAGF
jgi:hypothetical protein